MIIKTSPLFVMMVQNVLRSWWCTAAKLIERREFFANIFCHKMVESKIRRITKSDWTVATAKELVNLFTYEKVKLDSAHEFLFLMDACEQMPFPVEIVYPRPQSWQTARFWIKNPCLNFTKLRPAITLSGGLPTELRLLELHDAKLRLCFPIHSTVCSSTT